MNTMNMLLLTTLLGTTLLTVSLETEAQNSEQTKYREGKDKQTSIKCHVEYGGGGEAIRFVVGKFNNVDQAKQVFQGKKIRVGANKARKQIYKVHECVKQKDEFISASAKRLDKNTAR